MEYMVIMDERGRIIIPSKIRKILKVEGGNKFIIRVKSEGIVELIPISKIHRELTEIFEGKFRGWREEDHEASKELSKLVD